ncbi:hypothetical protein SLT36_09400 [Aminobacter sp. BA135]|uniref:hypothetical protein n=1 Tax=Aminobacter sp. BA135 TaxID=537596 RepID=UPI003D7BFB4B
MNQLVPNPVASQIEASQVPTLLGRIRPQWRAKSLIERVQKLLVADPSSACQRLFNAAIHDLREKIVVAGLDIAKEAAQQHRLPPVATAEDVENYATSKIIDLAYRMGLLSRADWRRVSRCYEIRRDLEHEDDEYEAGVEDCVYIFQTCIESILSKDPIHLLKVTDVKEIVEKPNLATPDDALLEDFEHAPSTRQVEILKFLVSKALDASQPDVVQQNAYTLLGYVKGRARSQSITSIGEHLQEKIGRNLDTRHARVAYAVGAAPYLRKAAKKQFFEAFLGQMKSVGHRWTSHAYHGELLRSFKEIGAFDFCPEEVQGGILTWLVRLYIGESGGVTSYGNVRNVYYSNSGAPLVRDIIEEQKDILRKTLHDLANDKNVKAACADKHVARRFENLLDIVDGE